MDRLPVRKGAKPLQSRKGVNLNERGGSTRRVIALEAMLASPLLKYHYQKLNDLGPAIAA
jgi:hypothetical protein